MPVQTINSRPWAQGLLGIPAVVVIGGIAAAMNWRFGQKLGHTELDGYLFGALGVALVALNWILPGAAAHAAFRKARLQQLACILLWVVCAAYTLVSAVGFSASHRAENGADQAKNASRYETAQADRTRLTAELTIMKASPKYAATAGCADATARASKEFCARVAATMADIREAKATMDAGRPAPVDAQAATLSRLTGFDTATVSTALAIAVAVVMELVSSLGFFAVAHAAPMPVARHHQETIPVTVLEQVAPVAPKQPEPIEKRAVAPMIGHNGEPVEYPPKRPRRAAKKNTVH